MKSAVSVPGVLLFCALWVGWNPLFSNFDFTIAAGPVVYRANAPGDLRE